MNDTSEAYKRRVDSRLRVMLIAALEWKPEPVDGPAGDRYAATTGELRAYLNEHQPDLVTRIDAGYDASLASYREAAIKKLLQKEAT